MLCINSQLNSAIEKKQRELKIQRKSMESVSDSLIWVQTKTSKILEIINIQKVEINLELILEPSNFSTPIYIPPQ